MERSIRVNAAVVNFKANGYRTIRKRVSWIKDLVINKRLHELAQVADTIEDIPCKYAT